MEPRHPLVAAFAAHLATRASPHTRNAYVRDVKQLALLAVAGAPPVALERITGSHLRRFLSTLHGRGLSGRTLARMLSSWRGFFKYLAEEGKVKSDPCVGLRPPRSPKKLPDALSPDEATRLVVVGQGHVGLPLAMRACEVGFDVVGLDTDGDRIKRLDAGQSVVEDVSDERLSSALASGRYHPSTDGTAAAGFAAAVISVPTPLREGRPDLSFIESAAALVADRLAPGARAWWLAGHRSTEPAATAALAALDLEPVLDLGLRLGEGTGALLAERSRRLGLDATVVLADTFRGVVGAGSEDPWYRGGEHSDTSVALVEDLLGRFPGISTLVAEGMFPDDTGDALADRSLRLVHIDVDVYDSAKATLEWAWPRLGVGGLVIFDDYGFYECEGVATLGAELMAAAGRALRGITSLNGHLTLVKLSDEPLPTC